MAENQAMDIADRFRRGVDNAVRTCMGVTATDRVFVITDQATSEIGAALGTTARGLGAKAEVVELESYGKRPILKVPDRLLKDIVTFQPSVTFYAAGGAPGEVTFRIGLMDPLLRELRVRHGHMIGVDRRLILEGMQADYAEVAALTNAVCDRARQARELRATSPSGTDLLVRFSPDLRWKPCTGLYHSPGEWGNLPEGEAFTSPKQVDGVLVGEVIGDYFSEKFGVLESPVYVHVEDSRVRKVECAEHEVAAELEDYLHGAANGTRAGEFAIGTNLAVTALTGNLLQDEKIPGIHIAFGNPYPHETGANWRSDVHVDIVSVGGDIALDGVPLMKAGRFVGL